MKCIIIKSEEQSIIALVQKLLKLKEEGVRSLTIAENHSEPEISYLLSKYSKNLRKVGIQWCMLAYNVQNQHGWMENLIGINFTNSDDPSWLAD